MQTSDNRAAGIDKDREKAKLNCKRKAEEERSGQTGQSSFDSGLRSALRVKFMVLPAPAN
jgi:hypothetical protein